MALTKQQIKQMALDISAMMDALDRGMTLNELRHLACLRGVNKAQFLAAVDAAVAFRSLQPEGISGHTVCQSSECAAVRTSGMTAESRMVMNLWIGSKVEKDYERRGVFPELRVEKSIYAAAHGSRYKVSRELIKAVAEDAIEQRAVKRTRDERGLACSYGTMSKNLLRDLGMGMDARVEATNVLKAERATHDDSAIRALFSRLSIPSLT